MWFRNAEAEENWVSLKNPSIVEGINNFDVVVLFFDEKYQGLIIGIDGGVGNYCEYFLNKKDLTDFIEELTTMRDNMIDVEGPPEDEL